MHGDRGQWHTVNFKNLRWQTATILKIVKSPYLNKNYPILLRLGTQQHY